MAWLILGIAVFTEICWALSLKWAATIASWQASIVPIALSFLNMALLALAMRAIPAGTEVFDVLEQHPENMVE